MENKKIKVAHVIGMAINGGTESLWINYYKNINRDLIQFDFLVESESKLINKKEIEKLGGNVIIIPSYKNVFKYMRTLKKIFKKNKYDIVHSNMNALSVFPLRAAKKAGIKIRIAHSHSTSNKLEWKKNIIKNLLRLFSKKYATHYMACSERAGRWLFGNKTFDSGKVTIIKNAIDIDKFKFNHQLRKNIRSEYFVSDDEILIGNIGRMMPQKNQLFLLDVFSKFHSFNQKSKLMIVNDGPLLEKLKTKVESLRLKDSVIFVGPKTNISDFYSAFDVFTLPSLYEGLGIVLIEAQANGLNCLASQNVPHEVDVTGNVLFLDLDIEKWFSELKKISTSRSSWTYCSDCLTHNNYCITNSVKKLEDLYCELIYKTKE